MQRRSFLSLALAGFFLAGCATPNNVDKNYVPDAAKNKGLALFSVTHDFGPPAPITGLTGGANVRFHIGVRGGTLGKDELMFFSMNESLFPSASNQFDSVWGKYYVQELSPGRYEIFSWEIVIMTGVGERIVTPKKAPPPITFEVISGKSTYIGNLHANISYGHFLGIPMPKNGLPAIRNEAERDLKVIFKEYPQLEGKVSIEPLPLTPLWMTE